MRAPRGLGDFPDTRISKLQERQLRGHETKRLIKRDQLGFSRSSLMFRLIGACRSREWYAPNFKQVIIKKSYTFANRASKRPVIANYQLCLISKQKKLQEKKKQIPTLFKLLLHVVHNIPRRSIFDITLTDRTSRGGHFRSIRRQCYLQKCGKPGEPCYFR